MTFPYKVNRLRRIKEKGEPQKTEGNFYKNNEKSITDDDGRKHAAKFLKR